MENIQAFFDFLNKSPSMFHAVNTMAEILKENSFIEYKEGESCNLQEGKNYFVRKNNSSIIAFKLPCKNQKKLKGFLISASHSDSPGFKIKENPEMENSGVSCLNVEGYGGMIMSSWFDRPLSIAGRITYQSKEETSCIKIKESLVNIEDPLLMIPNLAIHMNRGINDAHKYSIQKELKPIFCGEEKEKLLDFIAKKCRLNKEDILGHDLFLYNRTAPCIWGANKEFFSAPKIDNLESAFASLKAFVESLSSNEDFIPVFAVFDNEEVGSGTKQGADSTFLYDTLNLIHKSLYREESFYNILSKSFMLSIDNGHAAHPNYAETQDPVNKPVINGGILIKYNANQKYTTDAVSAAVVKVLCKKANVPFQIYTNNSDFPGGSTLGNKSSAQLSINTADIGLSQWAMHSSYESAGVKDLDYMINLVKCFYQSSIEC